MNIQTERLISACKAPSKEMCFCGVSAFFGESEDDTFAVGKLYDYATIAEHISASPVILFFSSLAQLAYALPRIQKGNTAGIVLSARALNEKTVEALMAYSLPFLALEYQESLPEHCFGEIAILDAKQGNLTVNPNADTIKRYLLSSRGDGSASLYLPNTEGISIAKSKDGGILLRASSAQHSGELFALLRSFAEANIERRITVSLELLRGALWEERFCEDIEAVFLAALYGNISIMLEGYHLPSDVNRALTLLKHSFCRLVENRREFNGCLKKGLMISAPLWLTQGLPMSHPDTVCLELDTLARRALGCESEVSSEQLSFLKSPLLSFAKRHQSIPLSATLSASADASLKSVARELCESAGIRESYF